MRPVTASIPIDAPRERVFELLCDLAARPAFADHFLTDYRLERLDPVGVGAAARFRLGDTGRWMETVIEDAEPAHLVREQGRLGRLNRVPAFTVWELVEGPAPEGCEVSVTFWTEPRHPLDRLRELRGAARFWRRGWRRALARLRELVESERKIERVRVAGGERLPALPG